MINKLILGTFLSVLATSCTLSVSGASDMELSSPYIEKKNKEEKK